MRLMGIGRATFTRALLRLERTMNVLCHYREGGREGRGGERGDGGTGREGTGGDGTGGECDDPL